MVRTNHNNSNKNQPNKKVEASSSQAVLTSQSDWEAGSYNSGEVDTTTTPGSIFLKVSGGSKIDLSTKIITADPDGTKMNLVDGSTVTGWGYMYGDFKIDLGSIYNNISKIRWKFSARTAPFLFQTSTDDVAYTTRGSGTTYNWEEVTFDPAISVRYLKSDNQCESPLACGGVLDEVEMYINGALVSTHTSGAMQIYGTDNFWQWQTFTPTYTKPANTDIQFRFRTSADGSSWNSWTDYQSVASGGSANLISLVTSWSGSQENPGTFYKYIQAESKLTSTDGVSTPTLSEYSIGYHTNRPPDKPVAGTVIIGN